MKIFNINLNLLSPAIIVRRTGKTGYSTLTNYIPASVIRGAFLSKFYREGVNEVVQESKDPKILFTYAYPAQTYIAHAFTVENKITKNVYTLIDNPGDLVYGIPLIVDKFMSKIESYKEKLSEKLGQIKDDVERGILIEKINSLHMVLFKNIIGSPIRIKNDTAFRFEAETYTTMSVGISKNRATSEEGMLFSYEALAAGLNYQCKIIDLEGKFEEYLDKLNLSLKNGFEIRLGRGISRGFGRTLVKMSESYDAEKMVDGRLSEVIEHIELMNNKYVILKAESPISLPLASPSGLSITIAPEKLDLSSYWIRKWSKLNIDIKLKLLKAYGQQMTIKSFSVRTGLMKPQIKASKPGSIFIYESKNYAKEDLAIALSWLEILGLNELSCLGLNNFSTFIHDPIPKVG